MTGRLVICTNKYANTPDSYSKVFISHLPCSVLRVTGLGSFKYLKYTLTIEKLRS